MRAMEIHLYGNVWRNKQEREGQDYFDQNYATSMINMNYTNKENTYFSY